jgi:DNA polymerase
MERGGDPITPAQAASLLAWWNEAGVDVAIDETPRDWLRSKAPAATTPPVLPTKAGVGSGTKSSLPAERGHASAGVANAAVDTPPDQLQLFQGWLRDHDDLPFTAPGTPRVCPSGDPASGLMLLADMPAAEDCATGTLLSGDAGRLFDRMLAAIGRDRASIYLASLSCLRSPDGRWNGEASGRCAALARHHVGLVGPRVLLVLGDAPAKALIGISMTQGRGRWHKVQTHAGPVKALVTLPPDLLLKQPGLKAHAWADLQMLMQGLSDA